MCGIVAYLGHQEAYPIQIEGIKRLENRGYDSAGVALLNGKNELNVYKTKGKVSVLEHFAADKVRTGKIGVYTHAGSEIGVASTKAFTS